MTLTLLDETPGFDIDSASRYTDNVIPQLVAWSRRGERSALVTLVGIDGTAPRALGAQMAVSENGQWAGYISGGCLEQAIALEAVEAIRAEKHRLIRYGKGSPYFDIRLPCGSGLDVLIQPSLRKELIGEMDLRISHREPFEAVIDIAKGTCTLNPVEADSPSDMHSHRDRDDRFRRIYTPSVRCLIIGASPIAVLLAQLSAAAGFETVFHTPGFESTPALPSSVVTLPFAPPYNFAMDPWTAAILAFHDHEQEMPALEKLLNGPSFFVAAIGSRTAHELRMLALREAGFEDAEIARLRSPAGLVAGLKSAPHVALSILAEVIAVARERQLLV